ncbi:MAG: hypothetical protein KBG49_10955 [Spirochaetes bacterium]|nr:hypothetical protein [Spirochaetota bacterium]
MKKYYIQNVSDATIVCKSEANKEKNFVFRPRKVDRYNGQLIYTGVTEISEEDLNLLKKDSQTFNFYLNLKHLLILNEIPPDALTPEQKFNFLQQENEELKRKVRQLEKELEDYRKDKPSKKKIEEGSEDGKV